MSATLLSMEKEVLEEGRVSATEQNQIFCRSKTRQLLRG
jgi:hypothetical protein